MSIQNFRMSRFFWFNELFHTSHMDLLQKNMEQSVEFVHDATDFARDIMDECRVFLGPFSPESWFRGPELNARVGGSAGSGHMGGVAFDYSQWKTWDEVMYNGMGLASHLKAEGKNFKIIIESKGGAFWVHVGKSPAPVAFTGIEGVYAQIPIA